MENEQVLAAYKLWKDNLISKEVFYQTLDKIKGAPAEQPQPKAQTPTNPQAITPGQVNYIKKLMDDGKIPKTQTLNLSKTEAQILIHNAVNSPASVKSAESAEVEEEKPKKQLTDKETEDLYDEESCYF